jgi:hypothetical protein
MRLWHLLLVVAWGSTGVCAVADEATAPLFPFVLPWDDATASMTNLSDWLPRPAGKSGPIHAGADGHLYAGDRRIRFLGVNFCFDANFPTKEDAPKVAARLAKFGINVVRFHHMDMFAYPSGIRTRKAAGTSELDPEALDRLDFLIAELKRRGIYSNLNLLVSRPINAADGLPADVERVGWKDRHVVGFFDEPALRTQKDYARNLLSHRNPYTGMTYADDPAVAFVEINNENGLVHAWLGRQVDALPDVFRRDLQRQWNAWLRQRYETTEKLRKAWGTKEEPEGAELLANADLARGVERWALEQHEQAEATVTISDDLPEALRAAKTPARSLRIAVTRPGAMAWHVQLNQSGLKVQAERPYTLRFWAKADKALTLHAEVGQAHDPWQNLGLETETALTSDWQQFRYTVLPRAADDNVRVNFTNLGRQSAVVSLAGISFRSGGVIGLAPGERLEDQSVQLSKRARTGERTLEGQRDWLRFLWEKEDAYWQTMRRYLKDELKVRGVVVGTIVGCSTPNLMSPFDAVDTHAYWQHPQFPGKDWDEDNWTVSNRTMVNEPGGTLPGLAQRRVLAKPHTVTEYNHPAPNTFASEGFLLLAAYGALQDWDAIYAFAYSQSAKWDKRHIVGFFDIDQHPTKMATIPAAVALFVRGDVKPAEKQVRVALDKEHEIDALLRSGPWELVHAGSLGLPRETALVHRVALVTGEGKQPVTPDDNAVKTGAARYASDTGQLLWDLSNMKRGVVTVDTPRGKAVIGYGGGKRFDLGGVVLEPGATVQDGWCTVTLTALDGDLAQGPARLLLTATGTAENTDMRWKSAAKESVGRNWGKAPSLVEGVPLKLTLPAAATRVQAWALDERGQRREKLPVTTSDDGKAVVAVGPDQRTLWYEIEVK